MATKVQQNVVVDNSSFADFKGWAGDITAAPGTGTGIAAALSQLGFTKMSDTYTAQWDAGTTLGAAALPINAGNLFSGTVFPATSLRKRAQLAGSNFLGAWASGSYAVGNVVTYATTGLVYICIAAATTQNPSNTSFWAPYWMEIWKAHNPALSDFFIKFEYGGGATAANPQVSMQLGTAYVTNSGVLSGNVTDVEQCFAGTTTFTTSEWDFAGDGQNCFGWMLGRNQGSNAGVGVLYFERSISGQLSGAPVYTSSYVTYGVAQTTGGASAQNTLFMSGATVKAVRFAFWPTCSLQLAQATLLVNNQSPALPIFPLLGYVGNPISIMIMVNGADMIEGTIGRATVYGTAHAYLQSISWPGVGNGAAGGPYGIGLRWE